MPYDPYDRRRTFRPIQTSEPTEVPSDLNRRAVLNMADQLKADATAVMIAEELRLNGHPVPMDEVRGALAGM